jgi:hypothetical protein
MESFTVQSRSTLTAPLNFHTHGGFGILRWKVAQDIKKDTFFVFVPPKIIFVGCQPMLGRDWP